MKLSRLAETLIGSEIVKLGNEIRAAKQQGAEIYNYTVGDFDPEIFPIPQQLEAACIKALQEHRTNYPIAQGNPDVRKAIAEFIQHYHGLSYPAEDILIAAGGRPLIYATYCAIVDPGDTVVYAIPSWNNNHYTHLVGGKHSVVETTPETHFMPTAAMLKPKLKDAVLLALCSPQNPTGTTFSEHQLAEICDVILEENANRGGDQKKCYLMYDQMYGLLTHHPYRHVDPVSLRPAMRDYTIYIDAISKMFSATGLRLGWAMGPARLMEKMRTINTHVGAWAPTPMQYACAEFLGQRTAIDQYIQWFKEETQSRLQVIYDAIIQLKQRGIPVDALAPEAAIYLTLKLDLCGAVTPAGDVLENQDAVTHYILYQAGLAIVPFYAFGSDKHSPWYRLSVGTCSKEEIPIMLQKLEQAITSCTFQSTRKGQTLPS